MKGKYLYGVTILCILMGLSACSRSEEKTQPEVRQLASEEPVKQEPVKQELVKQEPVKEEPVEKESDEEGIYTPAEEWLYTFEKCSPDLLPEGGANLLNINDPDIAGYIDEECLTIGRVITRFGEPDYVTNDMENLYSSVVAATDRNGKTVYLEIYFGPSGNAIGGVDEAEEAAKELRDWIQEAKPSDYKMECVYEDLGIHVTYSVKDRIPMYKDDLAEDSM